MKQILILIILFVTLSAQETLAGNPAEIELNDGSVVRGEIVSFSKGEYTFKSESLGTITVDETRIKNIRIGASQQTPSKSPSTGPSIDEQITALQNGMESDRSTMDKITSLQSDPDFQSLLNDPEIMNAVSAGNISALMSNPKLLNLINKPAVQEIIKGITK
jgi:hypothetical protein